jgi:8-oxo-dGTP pyrophosphatase MutT (NUDIX family)
MGKDDYPRTDPGFLPLRERLLALEAGFEAVTDQTGGRIQAAVSVVLRAGEEWEVLLIKRAEAEGDPWSGQMALPGGRRDVSDENLLHTAMRETREETSVILEEAGVHLGRLEPTAPNTVRLPPITIFPFVFGVANETQARVSSREVDEVLWSPLSEFRSPTAVGTVEIRYPEGSSREFPCFRIRERVVWGLTYRILTGFFELL